MNSTVLQGGNNDGYHTCIRDRDAKTFDENFEAFGNELQALDATLGPVLKT
jgi:hypothetical protein